MGTEADYRSTDPVSQVEDLVLGLPGLGHFPDAAIPIGIRGRRPLWDSTLGIGQVTPRMVDLGQGKVVELFVEIRDGELDFDQQVDDIPTVDESTLTTTAVVEEAINVDAENVTKAIRLR